MTHPKAKVPARRMVRAPAAAEIVPKRELDLEEVHGNAAKPISLKPLDFRTAIKGLLAVPWPQKKKKKKGGQSS